MLWKTGHQQISSMSPTNQAIQDAIDAGWDDTNYAFSSEDKKGSYIVGPWEYDDKVFLDPLFWQCLGKARGWGFAPYVNRIKGDFYPYWQYQWHRFIDHLAAGRDTESFFETL